MQAVLSKSGKIRLNHGMSGNILHLPSWTRTALGTDVPMFQKEHTPTELLEVQPMLFIGGVHGDEPEGVRLAEDLLGWIQGSVKLKRNLHPWFLIPCINPDGYKKNERTNGRGVDLNRNFPSRDWSPEAKAPRYNPGPAPASEPEVQALVSLIDQVRPKVIVHFHSWEPCVVYTGAAGKKWAEKLARGTGYEAREDIGYPTPGSLGQYGFLEKNIPVICIEAKVGEPLEEIWPRFGRGLADLLMEHHR